MKCKLSDTIGRGVQLFRIRKPTQYFIEVAQLPSMPQLAISDRRVWKARDEEVWYGLLTIPYADEEQILVRGPHDRWDQWNWKALAEVAESCRWRGPDLDQRYVI